LAGAAGGPEWDGGAVIGEQFSVDIEEIKIEDLRMNAECGFRSAEFLCCHFAALVAKYWMVK
jgi:hypothetical protein